MSTCREPALIKPQDFISGEKAGAGLFEEAMRSIGSQLLGEFQAHRITDSEYTGAYVTTLVEALKTAMQYSLQYPVNNQQIILMDEQIRGQQLNNDLTVARIRNLDADTTIKVKQLVVMDKQLLQMDKELVIADKQIEKLSQDIEMSKKQVQLLTEQITNTAAQTEKIKQDTSNALNQHTTITKQQLKTDQETLLLKQKLLTETAQIADRIEGSDVVGMIGKQKNLYQAQIEGFSRDAEQKASKIMVDTWIALLTTLGEADPNAAGLSNTEVDKVLQSMKKGIGVV